MNQCHKCESGKAWVWNEDQKKIDFSQCGDLTSEYSNCVVKGSEGCVVCETGFELTAEAKCVSGGATGCSTVLNGGYGFLRKEEQDKGAQIRQEIGIIIIFF
jgi:hypothetical protein